MANELLGVDTMALRMTSKRLSMDRERLWTLMQPRCELRKESWGELRIPG